MRLQLPNRDTKEVETLRRMVHRAESQLAELRATLREAEGSENSPPRLEVVPRNTAAPKIQCPCQENTPLPCEMRLPCPDEYKTSPLVCFPEA